MEFINKWPNWVRWVILAPSAALASIVGIVSGRISISTMEMFSGGIGDSLIEACVFTLLQSFMVSSFVLVCIFYVSPKNKWLSCAVASVIITIICGATAVLYFQSQTDKIPEFIASIIGLLFGAWAPTFKALKERTDNEAA